MKRRVDIILAVIAIALFALPIAIIAMMVRLRLGSPILFRQIRTGLHGKPFELVKFRSMRESIDERGTPLHDEERLTRFGRFLRATSLDELPELWNVLRGDMSLVGPRPLLIEYFSLYSPRQARRHEVRPGITGWAQINGRNSISWEQKFELDVWYVDNASPWLDFRILWGTLGQVVRGRGVSSPGEATVARFEGGDT